MNAVHMKTAFDEDLDAIFLHVDRPCPAPDRCRPLTSEELQQMIQDFERALAPHVRRLAVRFHDRLKTN
jgi:2,4-dienoyl-CoA reductase-like NADH-dependent reductase (Old Yellow Enzyme family)